MALYEFYCGKCQGAFEQITSSTDPDRGKCPKCQTKSEQKLISKFAVGGRGDLRESTWHGCHEAHVPLGPQSSKPESSSEGSGSGGGEAGGGHTHHGGCNH